jgi:hypothetical protein
MGLRGEEEAKETAEKGARVVEPSQVRSLSFI